MKNFRDFLKPVAVHTSQWLEMRKKHPRISNDERVKGTTDFVECKSKEMIKKKMLFALRKFLEYFCEEWEDRLRRV